MQELAATIIPDWDRQFRIIPSKFPPINFFEKLVRADQMAEIFYLESLTNDRLREEVGDISLVRPEDRVCGEGSSVVMAAFTHIGKNSRFTDGSYGVYYASRDLKTAVIETVFWREKFLAATNELAGEIDMRVYVGKILKPLHNIRNNKFQHLHHPDNYLLAQSYAVKLRSIGSFGLLYNSVRNTGGECIAAFRPSAISIPIQSKHLAYVWNGEKISCIFEKSEVVLA
ncbi:MAG TPA: RES family NAD+ phosphorylase [Gammaproteobacteria bacterium]|nr:RES family NAD+ phosphorylase [Gammaproteobacteria bacterium]HRA42563.1 RES family NAD+ phosphorylase [Gammaproteobacteria bacterium]